MPNIQIITDGHPANTTLIIDGVDITDEYEIGSISLEVLSNDPENPRLPYFKLEYNVIENDPLRPGTIETSTKKFIVLPDSAGVMQNNQ